VADDNQDAADSLAMILEMAGHDVRVVHDGRSALSVAHSFRPDAVLLDIGMPQLNGYEVARALRKQPWGNGLTLIALTGWGQDSDRQQRTSMRDSIVTLRSPWTWMPWIILLSTTD
jgi:DNA-binding response OmpR family regulator